MAIGIAFNTPWTDEKTGIIYPTLYFEVDRYVLKNQTPGMDFYYLVWLSQAEKDAGKDTIKIRGQNSWLVEVDDASFTSFFLTPLDPASTKARGLQIRDASYSYLMLLTNSDAQDPYFRAGLPFDFKNDGTLV